MKNKLFTLLLTLTLALIFQVSLAFAKAKSSESSLQQALIQLNQGAYTQALSLLEKLPPSEKQNTQALYWKGVCLSKLQKFEEAIPPLKKAFSKDETKNFKDTPYLLGQAYYATQQYKEAKDFFQRSKDRSYKIGVSLYYIGYIQNVLDEETAAIESFKKILTLPESDSEMKQPALFQLAEIEFERANEDKDNIAKRKAFKEIALPAYEKVIAYKSDAPLAKQSEVRISEIRQKMGEALPKTKSGAVKPAKAWMVRLKQNLKYDSNIVNQADDKILKISNSGSMIEKTGVFGKYEHIIQDRYVLTPEVGVDASYALRRTVPSVFSNDTIGLTPAFRTRIDHKVNEKTAAFLGEYEYAFNWRDYKSQKEMLYFNQSNNFIVGERVEIFPFGNSTAKFNVKFSENHDSALNYYAPALNLSQSVKVTPSQVLSVSLTAEIQTARNEDNDQKSLSTNLSYSVPNLIWGVSADASTGFTLTDTMHKFPTRGMEKNLSPGITFTKYLDPERSHFSISLNYTFTRNWSKDTANYAYFKHVVDLGVQFTF